MTIEKHYKALKFLTGAKYLTKDFKVAKFTGVEPDRTPQEIEEHLTQNRNKNDRTA